SAALPLPDHPMRIVAWNIRGGGGVRAAAIARQLARWGPDVVALSEFRATPPSCALAERLRASGLAHQITTADATVPNANALLIASRWPVHPLQLRGRPSLHHRWLAASVAAPQPLVIGTMHVPNRVGGEKYPFL